MSREPMPPIEAGDVFRWTGRDGVRRSEVLQKGLLAWFRTIVGDIRSDANPELERDGLVIWRRDAD